MPQVIISLPNAIFPILSHFLNFQSNEEIPPVQQQHQPPPQSPPPPPQLRTPSTLRRVYARPHRRFSQTQPIPRHRLSRHNLRNRREQRTPLDTNDDLYL